MLSDMMPGLSVSLAGTGMDRLKRHYWYNPLVKSQLYMIPGLVIMIITIVTLLLGSLAIVKEKEAGTMDQLIVSPLSRGEIILGKLLPFLLYSWIEMSVAMFFAYVVFSISPAGSVFDIFIASGVYLFSTLGLALFVSTISATQTQALFLSWFFMVILILLSGFMIPIANMPEWLKILTLANPLRYMMSIMREIYIKGVSLLDMWRELVSLFILGAFLLSASVIRFSFNRD
jgi:ABC-2 type transport system permease protein